jgi:hypothetical protein
MSTGTVALVAAVVVVTGVANALYVIGVRYAAHRTTVDAPGGRSYDVLVHREGVMLYTRTAGSMNAYSVIPTAIALARRWRRGPWQWAVTVRPAPFAGYKDLFHDVVGTREDADARGRAIELAIGSGRRFWPEDAEWFR